MMIGTVGPVTERASAAAADVSGVRGEGPTFHDRKGRRHVVGGRVGQARMHADSRVKFGIGRHKEERHGRARG